VSVEIKLPRAFHHPVGRLDEVFGGRVGLSPVMVGRSSALTQLQALVPAAGVAAADLPAVALVAGEAGVGKTRLLREFASALPDSVTLLAGSSEPDALSRPYSLVRAVVPTAIEGGIEPDEVVSRIAVVLGDGPAVLIFDDLHWADAESATVIDRLAQLPRPRLLLIGTYRPDELSRRLPGGDLLLRLERRHAVEQVRLDRLSLNEVGAMVAGIYGTPPVSAVIEALYTRSGGNPFFVEEILSAACGPEVEPAELLAARLPWSLEEAVRHQLEGLSAEERRVLEAAAICGPRTQFEVLARAADLPEDELLDLLRSLVRADRLVEAADDRFSFRHALVCDEVQRQLLGRERRLLHQRALDALRAVNSNDLAALARHAAGAGRFDEFVAYARDGARQYLDSGSTFQALRLADDALSEAPEDPALLSVATQAAWLVSLYGEALGYAERWYAAGLRTGSVEEQAAALRWRLRLHHELERPEAVDVERHRLESLIDLLPAGESRARAMAGIAQSYMLQDSTDDAVAWADRAIAEAEPVGAKPVIAQAKVERASAWCHEGRTDHTAELREAIDEAEAVGDWVLVARGLNNLFESVPVFAPEGRDLVERFRRAASRAGFDAMSNSSAAFREGELAFGEADLAAARRAKDQGEEWWLSRRKTSKWNAILEFDLAFEEGRALDARTALDRLGLNKDTHAGWHARTELQVAWLQSDRAAVWSWSIAFLEAPFADHVYAVFDIVNVIDLTLDAGIDPALVRSALERALARHPARERAWPVLAGLLLAAEGRDDEAVAWLSAALAQPEPTLQRFMLGQLRVRLAQALVAAGDRARALHAVRQALDGELARWPGWRRDRAMALLARIEGTTSAPEGELTAREREVAALLSEGLTNGELARRLFISPKTAAVHVSNILMKLNMSSRAEVAAWAVRTGLADDVLGRAG
jgi:DNA-binding CsgD family transcriptional regulator